jgi:molecular chaperone DnaK
MTVGIDLGTTNSVVAHLDDDGEPEIIKINGNNKTPSVVQVREDETVVGESAVNQATRYPDTTVQKVKRHMGDDEWRKELNGTEFRPEGISALILEKLVDGASDQLGEEVDEAVITVPADFSITERQATKDAAEIAGIEVKQLLNEPEAACLRYGLQGTNETVLVYDLGGGTFDVTVVDLSEDGRIEVDGSRGAQRLGGEDFDDAVYEQLILPAYVEQMGEEPNDDVELKLRQEAKRVKEGLSDAKTDWADLTMPDDTFEVEITREEFNEATEHIVENTIDTIEDLFDGDNVSATKSDLDRVLLVGGSTRIPAVQDRVEEYFGMTPSKDLDQDLVVAEGAAIATDLDIGDTDTTTTSVVARPIGIEVFAEGENECETMIEQDVSVPTDNSKDGFTTVDDNQKEIEVKILEGDSDFAADNDTLGSFILENIEDAPAGVPEFDITFNIDENGILSAEARDLETGSEADHTLEIGLDEVETDQAIERKENIPAMR